MPRRACSRRRSQSVRRPWKTRTRDEHRHTVCAELAGRRDHGAARDPRRAAPFLRTSVVRCRAPVDCAGVPRGSAASIASSCSSAERRRRSFGATSASCFRIPFDRRGYLKRAGVKERWGYRSDFRRLLLTRSVPKPRGRVSFPEYLFESRSEARHRDRAADGAAAGAGRHEVPPR